MPVTGWRLSAALFSLAVSLHPGPAHLMASDLDEESEQTRPAPAESKRQSAHRAAADITVVASRTRVQDPGTAVTVISREEIARLPVRALPELLQWLAGVDVQRRGVEGVQADIGIRGADYNGTLILVDGEAVNDPQTNHHSANLDVPLEAVERVEILYGGASSMYGSGAVGGAINIVTRGADLKRARAQVEGRYTKGSHSLDSGGVRLASRITDSAAVSLDWNRSESSGFREDTEFSTNTLRFSGRLDTARGPVTLALGYATRSFGAYAFYGTTFPNQQESTRTRTGRLGAELNFGKWTVTPSVAIRDHHDDFVLDRNRPAFYENIHDTLMPTGRLVFRGPVGTGILAAGAEAASEEITSTNLGDHTRSRTAVFMEFEQPLSKDANTRLGLRWDAFSDFSSRLSPQLSFSYGISRALKLRASGSTAFRVPTFTELYYFDPQTRGNPDLAPEKSWSVEAGARYEEKGFMLDGALFYRDSEDLIDYVRYAPGNPYMATNIRRAEFTGIELAAGVAFAQRSGARITRLDVHFSYLFFDLEKLSAEAGGALEGRYVLDPLRSKFHLALSGVLPFEVTATARASYFQRPSTQTPGPIFDFRLGRQLFEGQIIELFVDGLNLTDRTFEERAGVPLPGRTFHAGFQVTW